MNHLQKQVQKLNKKNEDLYESIKSKFIETKGLKKLSFLARVIYDDGEMVLEADNIVINDKDNFESIDDFPIDLACLGGINLQNDNEVFFNNINDILDNVGILFKDEDEDVQVELSLESFKL